MNVLAINPGHNGSVAFWKHDKLKFYIEEERLSRQKYDGNPYRGMVEALKYGVDIHNLCAITIFVAVSLFKLSVTVF